MVERILMATSAGKDSTFALHELLAQSMYKVEALLTTVTLGYERISMHGVRRSLLHEHAEGLGIPLVEVDIEPETSHRAYEEAMATALLPFRADGIRHVAFGDLHLEDVRSYREHNLAALGMAGVFPTWGRDTHAVAQDFLELGFKAIVTCVDTEALPRSFVGRTFDTAFLRDLPEGADPCGENGEFHTFVFDGPLLSSRVGFRVGEIEDRGRYVFQDLVPT